MYETKTAQKSVTVSPICKSVTEILTDIKELKCIHVGDVGNFKAKWLRDLYFNCFSRVFVGGLYPGRTRGGAWKTFTNKNVVEANQQVRDNIQ
jgi:hypothetical protein